MQSLGEGLGDALRTFRQAVADVRGAVDPQMRTIQAEIDAAQKEVEQSIEAAKQMPAAQEDPPKQA
jgi:Sec-independent protein translocase protein TatA